jgi:hypothetical protein
MYLCPEIVVVTGTVVERPVAIAKQARRPGQRPREMSWV